MKKKIMWKLFRSQQQSMTCIVDNQPSLLMNAKILCFSLWDLRLVLTSMIAKTVIYFWVLQMDQCLLESVKILKSCAYLINYEYSTLRISTFQLLSVHSQCLNIVKTFNWFLSTANFMMEFYGNLRRRISTFCQIRSTKLMTLLRRKIISKIY